MAVSKSETINESSDWFNGNSRIFTIVLA